MSKFTIVLLTTLLLITTSLVATAQTRIMISLNAQNDGQEEFDRIMADFHDAALFYITSRLHELRDVCELTDTQYKKLSVASKGATKKFVAKEQERCLQLLRRYQQQAGFDMDKINKADEEKSEKSDDETSKDEEEEEVERPIRNFSFSLQTLATSRVEEELRWNDSVNKILTKEQVERLNTARSKRNGRIKDAAVDRFVAKMNLHLFLTDEQRPKIRKAVFDKFGDLLVKEIIFEDQYRRPTMRANQIDTEPEHLEMIKGILSEQQTRQWNRVVEPHLRYLKTLKNRR